MIHENSWRSMNSIEGLSKLKSESVFPTCWSISWISCNAKLCICWPDDWLILKSLWRWYLQSSHNVFIWRWNKLRESCGLFWRRIMTKIDATDIQIESDLLLPDRYLIRRLFPTVLSHCKRIEKWDALCHYMSSNWCMRADLEHYRLRKPWSPTPQPYWGLSPQVSRGARWQKHARY